ncbi:dCTP deaminase [Methanoplanus sp. FWC-SCC4]|uniref:dCTP deaminase, dUMP-forming n=1 Tax=Methanochimaera problematica TaxID=2609417 RepID=A0AA97FCG1_9EURY|nr:dCTP deaminase [Methanoplanus sp. FWC-SCC4]WOF15678.1 dCTP deaminase [Methanoplanus sp. FWC-SCC4]
MILVDWQIHDRIKRGFIGVEPFDEKFIQPNSLDIRLGNHFVWYDECDEVIDPYNGESITSNVSEKVSDYIDIYPGMFVLAETFESIRLPDDIVATIEGKSSIARFGITLHQTGGWIDAGFSGTITLEIYNANQRPVRLYAGMPIGQLVFYPTERASKPYGSKGDAKYFNQKNATLSRYYKNSRQENSKLDNLNTEEH